jgi:hypothetical protein
LIVFGFAESEAVGGFGAGGGGGGGGATFLWQALMNISVAKTNKSALHWICVVVGFVASFKDSSCFLCAHVVACNLQIHGRAHFRPAAKPFYLTTGAESNVRRQRLKAPS